MTDEPIPDYERRAQAFDAMAKQIRLNADAKFGGAFLLVPPADGEIVSSLMLNQEEAVIFWASIQSLTKMALEVLEAAQRRSGFGR